MLASAVKASATDFATLLEAFFACGAMAAARTDHQIQGRNLSGLRPLRRFQLACTVERNRLKNERLEGDPVNFLPFVDVNRAACVAVETGVEETGRVRQRRALGEGQLHIVFVGFARAEDAVVRPDWRAGFGGCDPLPFLDHVRVCLLDELAHPAKRFSAPVCEGGDSFGDEF